MMKRTNVLWNQRIFTLILTMTIVWTLPAAQAAAAEATGTLEWERALGANLKLLDVSEYGNGYSVVGLNKSTNFVYMAKLHADGTVYWEEELPLIAANGKRAVPEAAGTTKDGGYIVGATVSGIHYRYSDYYAAKLNAEGRIEWTNEYLSGSHASFNYIHQAEDGGYLYLNNTEVYLADYSKTSAGKMDADGNVQIEKTLASGRFTSPYARQILELKGGSYLVVGGKDQILYTWRLAEDFSIVDEQEYTELSTGKAAATADGGYTLAGVTQQGYVRLYENSGHQESNVVQLNLTGQVRSLYETAGGGYILGTSQGVYQTDSDGNILQVYEVSGLDKAIPTSDGNAVVLVEGRIIKLGSVQSLQLDSSEYSVNIGQPIDVIVTYFEGAAPLNVTKESSFRTSDPSIAYVDEEGNLIGVKRGRTMLTVTYNGLEAKAIVDVY